MRYRSAFDDFSIKFARVYDPYRDGFYDSISPGWDLDGNVVTSYYNKGTAKIVVEDSRGGQVFL